MRRQAFLGPLPQARPTCNAAKSQPTDFLETVFPSQDRREGRTQGAGAGQAAAGRYLDGVFTASTGPALNEGVAHVDDAADPVGIGVQLSLEGLVLLVLALKHQKPPLKTSSCQTARGAEQWSA